MSVALPPGVVLSPRAGANMSSKAGGQQGRRHDTPGRNPEVIMERPRPQGGRHRGRGGKREQGTARRKAAPCRPNAQDITPPKARTLTIVFREPKKN